MKILHLRNFPILEQLKIEEALLRCSSENFCLINEGSSPAIVLGISGKVEELVDQKKAREKKIPLIRRFSGGGTVVVDESTLFVTFICQRESFPAFPEPILKWTEELYTPLFDHPDFRVQENDYVFGKRKFGGNAQYLKKERWLHHTSFLWDYMPEQMSLLLHPKKTPIYRNGRGHEEFLCKMREFVPNREEFIKQLKQELGKRYKIQDIVEEDISSLLRIPHRQATVVLG
ncbi:MAG: lipoate--protein ligase family protein [Chlamydiales bacterium]